MSNAMTIAGIADRVRRAGRTRFLLTAVVLCLVPALAGAQDRIMFPAYEDAREEILRTIRAENVRIDINAWYLTEHEISINLVNRKNAGVKVRVLGDRGSIFEIDANTRREFEYLASNGVQVRVREHPRWFPEINHWKAGIFVGQNIVEFGSANWTPFELRPESTTNFKDETVLFTGDPALVNAFKTKFDQFWADTTYFVDWNEAYRLETGQEFPIQLTIDRTRLEPDYPMPADMYWGQGPEFNNPIVTEINAERNMVYLVAYRLTVDNITNALLAKQAAGVPVRVIVEPNEYRNARWPEFWITGANMDKLWANGVAMKQRAHVGLTHMKTLLTSNAATNASSNFAANWQRDHNYFMRKSVKPDIYEATRVRVEQMWNDTVNFRDFTPLGPDAPTLAAPGPDAVGQSTTPTLVWNRAPFATNYDVFLGTSTGSMTRVARVNALVIQDPPLTYSWTPAAPLAEGTRFYWKVVARTNATDVRPTLIAESPTRSFTTAGTGGGGGGTTAPEVVLYASDVNRLVGSWSIVPDSSAAGGTLARSADAGYSNTAGALASPPHYFEASFTAPAATRYRLWMRIRAKDNSKFNDSVFVQLSDAVNAAGSPIYRIGTTGGLAVNLAQCSTCATNGWGWVNSTYWLPDTGDVFFANGGTHTIRVQTREDGADIDQIVLSPSVYLNAAPGPTLGDNTIVPKPGGSEPTPPGAPSNPSPADGAAGVPTSAILSWTAASGATGYDVHFGTSTTPPLVASNIAATTYAPALSPSTTYHWRIVARNSAGTTSGPVWSFTTSTPPPAPPEVVIYAGDVLPANVHGNFTLVADASAAGGSKLASTDAGWSTTDAPRANPTDSIEVTFDAPANVPYRLWLRLRATGDSKWNDSLWAQFSDALIGGAPAYPIGSTSGLLINLENCSGCGTAAWGWINSSWWLNQSATVTFATSGPHTLRLQIREDGVALDQIVLSPSAFVTTAPGPVKNDTTIVQKP